MITRKRHSVTL